MCVYQNVCNSTSTTSIAAYSFKSVWVEWSRKCYKESSVERGREREVVPETTVWNPNSSTINRTMLLRQPRQIRIADRMILLFFTHFTSFHFISFHWAVLSNEKSLHISPNQLFQHNWYSIYIYISVHRYVCNTNRTKKNRTTKTKTIKKGEKEWLPIQTRLFINEYIFICMSLHCWLIYPHIHAGSFKLTQ